MQATIDGALGALRFDMQGDASAGKSLAILCHGFVSDRFGRKTTELFESLVASKIPALRFDFGGCGESEGAFAASTISKRRLDLAAVFDAVLDKKIFGPFERVVLYGSSVGGTVALLSASREPRIDGIVSLSALAHPQELRERFSHLVPQLELQGRVAYRGQTLDRRFVEDLSEHDVMRATGVLSCPVLVIHGENDVEVPVSDGYDIAASARDASLLVVPQAKHEFENPEAWQEAKQAILSFIQARC